MRSVNDAFDAQSSIRSLRTTPLEDVQLFQVERLARTGVLPVITSALVVVVVVVELPVNRGGNGSKNTTYIMFPDHFVCGRICIHFAFKVHVVPLLDVFRIHVGTELQLQGG